MKNKSPEQIAALHTPHNLMIIDNVIDINISGFCSSVTLGFTNPARAIQPAVTFTIPTDVLHNFANEILTAIKENGDAIKAQHQNFDAKI